jgi:hypothetical protein
MMRFVWAVIVGENKAGENVKEQHSAYAGKAITGIEPRDTCRKYSGVGIDRLSRSQIGQRVAAAAAAVVVVVVVVFVVAPELNKFDEPTHGTYSGISAENTVEGRCTSSLQTFCAHNPSTGTLACCSPGLAVLYHDLTLILLTWRIR